MSEIGIVHFTLSLVALATGGIVLLQAKGTRRAAIVSTLTLGAGLFSVILRRPRQTWLQHHAAWMAWSYVGLLGAFVAETLTRFAMPLLLHTLEQRQLVGAFWMLVAVPTVATVGVGSRVIRKRLPIAIAKVGGCEAPRADSLSPWLPSPDLRPAATPD